jgi:hypothetical protein
MDFVSVRVITPDVERLATFWEQVTGLPATRPVPVFAELRTPAGTIAIGAPATVGMLGTAAPVPGQSRSVFIELRVDDIDATWERVKGLVPQDRPRDRARADRHAVGQPLGHPARPRRRTGQPLYPGHPGGQGEVRPLTHPCAGAARHGRLPPVHVLPGSEQDRTLAAVTTCNRRPLAASAHRRRSGRLAIRPP